MIISEEILIRDSIRDYATNELMPRIQEANRVEVFDKNIYKELGELMEPLLRLSIRYLCCIWFITNEIERDSGYRSAYMFSHH